MFVVGCGGNGSPPPDEPPLFEPKPECEGDPVVALAGGNPQVINALGIGSAADGFDLDGDGKPDNKLAAASSLAQSAIDDSLAEYSIVIPIEFFDLDAAAPDQCVKFAFYLGDYVQDGDGDGDDPLVADGDCNDSKDGAAINRGVAEVAGNGIDDDCDGLADEDAQNNPSTSTADADGDGVTIAEGDCDDTDATIHAGAVEICGDRLDNDCDGVADRTERGAGVPAACSPFDTETLAEIPLDPLSFDAGGAPVISFKDGVISEQGGKLVLDAGPSIFSVSIPVADIVTLDLRITGAQIKADVVEENGSIVLKNGRLGGVIDARTADTIRGLDVEDIGLKPENSLLDATFANLLGPILALPKASKEIDAKYPGCRTPDIDVDRDGLEAFCDSNPEDEIDVVDICIDGDGTEVTDVTDAGGGVIMECTTAMKGEKFRFVDGISVALTFETTAIQGLVR